MSTFFNVELRVALPRFDLEYRLATDDRWVGVFGPSGAGKTTVIEIVAGWRRPDRGHVRIGERTLFDGARGVDLPPRERGVGYVPQDILLFPHWNVLRNVTAGAGRSRRNGRGAAPAPDLLERVLDTLELGPMRDVPVDRLSGGERHRVALARALCSEPDLLLLDEPLASLDLRLKRRILADLVRVREEFGVPMLLISHDATEVRVLCDRAQLVREGRVRAEGPPSAVLDGADETDYENVLRGRVAATDPAGALVVLEDGSTLHVADAGVPDGGRVIVGVRADEILLATSEPRDLSARNVLPARILTVESQPGGVVAVRTRTDGRGEGGGAELLVHVTAQAAADLALAPERRVHLIVKTRSLQVMASLPPG